MVKKNRKKQLSEKLAASRKHAAATTSSSLFEQKFTKEKYNVLGRNSKNRSIRCGKPNASKAKAFERRQNTLGHESATVGKTNKFVDRRLAEKWHGATKEEKMAQRFALVRRKRYAKDAFKLDENENLTHYGQNLAQIERFDKEPTDLADEDQDGDGVLPASANFGGGESNAAMVQSRKSIIDEMIVKSKMEKQEKQKKREEVRNLTDLLDEQWKEALQGNLFGSLGAKKDEISEIFEKSKNTLVSDTEKPTVSRSSDYDTLVRELVFDRRTGVAQDKLKTEQEIVSEQREKFEKFEAEKLRRMANTVFDSNSKILAENQHEWHSVRADHFNPDELDANFYDTKKRAAKDGNLLTYADGARLSNNSDEEDGNDKDAVCCEDTTEFDSVLCDRRAKKRRKISPAGKDEILTEFSLTHLPPSYDQLKKILLDLSDQELCDKLDELIKSLHPSLKVGNKQNLQKLFLYILRFFDEICQLSPINFKILDRLTIYLFKLKEYGKQYAGKSVKALLRKHRATFLGGSKNFKKPAPGPHIVSFMRLVPHLLPVTDFYHPIATPSFLFLSEILSRTRQKTLRDLACTLVIATIFLEYVKESKKFAPDLMNFLKDSLILAFSKKSPIFARKPGEKFQPLSLSEIFASKASAEFSVNSTSCLICILKLCKRLCVLYKDLPSWPEIFDPFVQILDGAGGTKIFGQEIENEMADFQATFLQTKSSFSRQFLAYGVKEKKEMEFLEPRLVKNFNPDKKRFKHEKGPMAQREKLKKQYKREYKGTVRELRRDNEFLARRQLEQAVTKDKERREKMKKLMTGLMDQEADYKKMKRSKD